MTNGPVERMFGRRRQVFSALIRSRDARHSIKLGLAAYLGPVGGLLANMAAARTLGADGRGQLAAVLVLFGTFETILTFGTPEIIARDIARKSMPLGAAKTITQYAIAVSIIPGIAVMFYCRHWGFPWPISIFVGVLMPAMVITAIARAVLLGEHRYRQLTASHLIYGVVRITAPLSLVIVKNPSISLGLLVFVSGTVAAAIPILASKPLAGVSASFRTVFPILKESMVTWWPVSATWPLYIGSDQLVLSATISTAELGRYAVCVAIAQVPVALAHGPRQILMARAARSGSLDELKKVALVVPLLGLAVGVLCVLTIDPAMSFVFGPGFHGLAMVVGILFMASAFEIALGILLSGRLVAEKLKRALVIQLLAVAFIVTALPVAISLGGGLVAAASVRMIASGSAFVVSRFSGW